MKKMIKRFIIRFIMLTLTLVFMKLGYAAQDNHVGPTADIHIKISGIVNNQNRYFLCMPNVGCLSILAGDEGKTYHMVNPIDLNAMYITDTARMNVYFEGAPKSCQVTVNLNQKVMITGQLTANNKIQNLNCSVSKI